MTAMLFLRSAEQLT